MNNPLPHADIVMFTTHKTLCGPRGAVLLSSNPEVIAVGAEYLLYLAGALVAWSFYFVCLRSLQGAGDMLVPMLISVS